MDLNWVNRALQTIYYARQRHQDAVVNTLSAVTSIDGKFLVDGAGEAAQFVQFPVIFIERPNFVTGGELHPGSFATAGSFPTVSCTIASWKMFPEGNTNLARTAFQGASVLVVTTGPAGQRMWIHWRATGRALTNPAGATDISTTDLI